MPFLTPNKQYESTEGKNDISVIVYNCMIYLQHVYMAGVLAASGNPVNNRLLTIRRGPYRF